MAMVVRPCIILAREFLDQSFCFRVDIGCRSSKIRDFRLTGNSLQQKEADVDQLKNLNHTQIQEHHNLKEDLGMKESASTNFAAALT